jgi:hypothetical protein
LLPFQVFDLSVLSISIAAIWGVDVIGSFFHIAVKVGYERKQKNFAKADITLDSQEGANYAAFFEKSLVMLG